MVQEKSREQVVAELIATTKNAVHEKRLAEAFYWERVREERAAGDEKAADGYQIKAGAAKQECEQYERWLKFLESQTS